MAGLSDCAVRFGAHLKELTKPDFDAAAANSRFVRIVDLRSAVFERRLCESGADMIRPLMPGFESQNRSVIFKGYLQQASIVSVKCALCFSNAMQFKANC